jgi:hypothetical protein
MLSLASGNVNITWSLDITHNTYCTYAVRYILCVYIHIYIYPIRTLILFKCDDSKFLSCLPFLSQLHSKSSLGLKSGSSSSNIIDSS